MKSRLNWTGFEKQTNWLSSQGQADYYEEITKYISKLFVQSKTSRI